MAHTIRSIERRALELVRQAEALSLPVDLNKVAILLGAKVHRETLEDEVSGVLIVKGNEKHVLLNKRQSARRQRFTLGHELGHLVLHDSRGDRLIVDKHIRVYRRVGESTSESYGSPDSMTNAHEEQEANTFAAAVLMPAPLLKLAVNRYALGDERDLESLATRFQVSQSALVIRLQHLNLVQFGHGSEARVR